MTSCDRLEARNTELEAALSYRQQVRIAELEAERDRLRDQLRRSGQGLAEVVNDKTRLEAERADDQTRLETYAQLADRTAEKLYAANARIAELEAERDTLSKRVIDCGEKLYQTVAERDSLQAALTEADKPEERDEEFMARRPEDANDADQRDIGRKLAIAMIRAALSDPSGE
jgi:chromosome segregation ATPase